MKKIQVHIKYLHCIDMSGLNYIQLTEYQNALMFSVNSHYFTIISILASV